MFSPESEHYLVKVYLAPYRLELAILLTCNMCKFLTIYIS